MSASIWVVAGLLTVLPIAAYVWTVWRSGYLRMQMGLYMATMGTAAALVVPIVLLERLLQSWAQIDQATGVGGQVTLLLYGFFIVAPLEMATVTVAVFPYWRVRRMRMRAGLSRRLETREGVSFAIAAAIGFVAIRNLTYLWTDGSGWLSLARAGLAVASFVLLCSLWGYVLGRNAQRGMGGRRFSSAVLAATVFSAVCQELIFRHSHVALLSVLPLIGSMLVVTFVLWREQVDTDVSSGGALSSFLTSAPAPSIQAIREAFRKQDRPLTLRWISFGAIVTTGMITAGIAGAVLLGHKLGLDFSAVDRHDAGADAMPPLALLSLGVLAAFPTAGYLLARASGTRSVLEPAMATALAMVLLMVFMGMLAPVSVVFAIAFAPIAFALSCAGAWVGLSS